MPVCDAQALIFTVLAVVVLGLRAVPHTQAIRLQIHFMDMGQGDGAILIAPSGEAVMFDNGVWNQCTKPTTCLTSLGIRKERGRITERRLTLCPVRPDCPSESGDRLRRIFNFNDQLLVALVLK